MKKNIPFLIIFLSLFSFSVHAQEKQFDSKRLSGQQLENLCAFAKMYGYIRHFQSVAQFDSLNWETFIVKESEFAASAKNSAELQSILDSICLEIGKDIWVCNKEMCATRTTVHNNFMRLIKPKAKYDLYQLQEGWGNRGVNKTKMDFIYKNRIITTSIGNPLKSGILSPDDFMHLQLTRELELCLPLTLYADESGSLSHPHEYPKFKIIPKNFSSSNQYVRIGSIIIAWNVIKHYYPYLKVMKIDWENVLPEYIQHAAECKSDEEFKELLQEFTVEYKDAHAWVYRYQARDSQPFFAPPVQIDFVEGRGIVTYSDIDSATLKEGDEIISIDHIPVKKYISDRMKLVSGATPQYIHYSTMNEVLCGKKNTDITLEIKLKDKKTNFLKLKRSNDQYMNRLCERRPAAFYETVKGVFYADLTRLSDSMMNVISPKLFQAKGLIFDARGYPRQYFIRDSLPCYLADQVIHSASFNTPVYYYPDQKNIMDFVKVTWTNSPSPKRLTKNVVMLIDGRDVSSAEADLILYGYNKLATLVGESTAGTNGNVNGFSLFGLYAINFTGMEILNQDGSQHHGVGIKPNIEVKKTAKALLERRDEFLEKATEVVKINLAR